MFNRTILSKQIGIFASLTDNTQKYYKLSRNNPYYYLINAFKRSNGNKMIIFSTNMLIGREFIKYDTLTSKQLHPQKTIPQKTIPQKTDNHAEITDHQLEKDIILFKKSYRMFLDGGNLDYNVLKIYKNNTQYIYLKLNSDRNDIIQDGIS